MFANETASEVQAGKVAGCGMNAHATGASQHPLIDGLRVSDSLLPAKAYLAELVTIPRSTVGMVNSPACILFTSRHEELLSEFLGKSHSRHQALNSDVVLM